jgi:hypothetical protein
MGADVSIGVYRAADRGAAAAGVMRLEALVLDRVNLASRSARI